ncbi:hypothetical protein DFS34DRAFT_694611 [Phlyctochytrium arcticum]|nr:hypothetical protein DFS34DRAFT_694611 [Phlyctochytrium arcticum]
MAEVEATRFGRTLWDQWENIEHYSKMGTQSLERMNEFLKRRAEIELDYAKQLNKLVKAQREEANSAAAHKGLGVAVMSGTCSQSWMQILTMTEYTASFHTSLSEQLDGELRKSIKVQIKDNEKLFKLLFDDVRKAVAEYRKVVENLEKMRQKYDKATRDMDVARQAYESANQDMNKTAKDIEKLRNDAEKKAIFAKECADAYQECINQTNAAKDKFYMETLPNMLDIIQSKDEQNRVAFIKTCFLRYSDLLQGQLPSVSRAIQSMVEIFDKITPNYDSATFIKMSQTHAPYPQDFTFEERALAPSAMKNKTVTRQFTKGNAELDDSKEDAIIVLPPKQGKKKATERIKVLDKDLAEVEKRLAGVETLISVYKNKPEIAKDYKVQRDLDDQHNGFTYRTAVLMHKKYKLQPIAAYMDAEAGASGAHQSQSPITPLSDTSSIKSMSNVGSAGAPNPFSTHTEEDAEEMETPEAFTPVETQNSRSSMNVGHGEAPPTPTSPVATSAPPPPPPPPPAPSGPTASAEKASSHKSLAADLPTSEESHEPDKASDAQQHVRKASGPPPPPPAHKAAVDVIGQAKVVYDFTGSGENDELMVSAGEALDVLEKQEDGWWRVRVHRKGQVLEGVVPGNYTEDA